MLNTPKPFYAVDLQMPPAVYNEAFNILIAMASIWLREGKTVYSCSCIIYKMP